MRQNKRRNKSRIDIGVRNRRVGRVENLGDFILCEREFQAATLLNLPVARGAQEYQRAYARRSNLLRQNPAQCFPMSA